MAAISRSLGQSFKKLLNTQNGIITSCQQRFLNLQEYQSKKLMADSGITVQRFRVVDNLKDANEVAKNFKAEEYVIKAQILAGGRGKGVFDTGFKGGVKLTRNPDEVSKLVESMLGNKLVTKQTPPGGVKVQKVMVAQALDISRETYFAILLDRETAGPILVGSPEGGMDIEQVAEDSPDKIFKEPIDIFTGCTREIAERMAKNLNFEGQKLKDCADEIMKLYDFFIKVDATQVEINPLGETPQGQVVCFDAKINFDDNAEFKHKEIFAMGDDSETDPREVEAKKYELNYVGMDGNIGCLVNGAGLAMATMDIIKHHGGEPANFLDCGGGVTEGQVLQAFKLLTSDHQVKAILVNVFGGIVDCSVIANGIIKACKNIDLNIPVVVRLEGTNVENAKLLLEQSGLSLTPASDFGDAAQKAVAALN